MTTSSLDKYLRKTLTRLCAGDGNAYAGEEAINMIKSRNDIKTIIILKNSPLVDWMVFQAPIRAVDTRSSIGMVLKLLGEEIAVILPN